MNEAQRKLVDDNLKLAYWQFSKGYDKTEDARQAALLGLCFAAVNYIENDKTKFASYATLIIRQHLWGHYQKNQNDVNITVVGRALVADINECVKNGLTDRGVRDELGISEHTRSQHSKCSTVVCSMDDDDALATTVNPWHDVDDDMMMEQIESAFRKVIKIRTDSVRGSIRKTVLTLMYNEIVDTMLGFGELSMTNIAEKYNTRLTSISRHGKIMRDMVKSNLLM